MGATLAGDTMTEEKQLLERIVEKTQPVEPNRLIEGLTESGELTKPEAGRAVDRHCVFDTRDGQTMVVGVRGSDSAVVAEITQEPGNPTGRYYTGRDIVHESEFDGEPVGLPVLEDVGHPMVPDLKHGYYPRELFGSRKDTEIVVKALADPMYRVLLIGETGVGKNVLLKYIFQKCNWPMQRVNFGLGVTPERLLGMYAPDEANSDEDMLDRAEALAETTKELDVSQTLPAVSNTESGFSFVSGVLKQAVEYGFGFDADELNAAPAEVTMFLHGLTEESQELVVPETSEVIQPHPRFKFMGTMNPEDYAGTNRMNRAFKTRFYPIRIDYMDKESEIALIMNRSRLSDHPEGEEVANTLVNLAQRVRSLESGMETGGTVTTPVSSRELIKIGNMTVDASGREFMPPKEATRMILKGVAGPNDWRSISGVIDSHFD